MRKAMLAGKVERASTLLDPKARALVRLEDAHGAATETGLELAAVRATQAELRIAEQPVAAGRPRSWAGSDGPEVIA